MTQEAIYKTPFGFHIDLDKIVTISDAKFLDRMGSGGWYVTFSITVQLRDDPITYTRELNRDTELRFTNRHHLVLTDGTTVSEIDTHKVEDENPSRILAVANLQKQVDELISAWKARQF